MKILLLSILMILSFSVLSNEGHTQNSRAIYNGDGEFLFFAFDAGTKARFKSDLIESVLTLNSAFSKLNSRNNEGIYIDSTGRKLNINTILRCYDLNCDLQIPKSKAILGHIILAENQSSYYKPSESFQVNGLAGRVFIEAVNAIYNNNLYAGKVTREYLFKGSAYGWSLDELSYSELTKVYEENKLILECYRDTNARNEEEAGLESAKFQHRNCTIY